MLPNREGSRVPQAVFKTRQDGQWVALSSDELFKNKTVVVFALPGAYTPTCSSTHLPRYNELASTFKAHGVDDVLCIAVNDAFVMSEWAKSQEAQNVTMIPDGNGQFTDGMGMLVDKSDLGLGKRSWRYSMLVRDGVIEKMFIEPEKEGDPLEVSDADTMLRYVAPQAEAPQPVTIFTKPGCGFCKEAKSLLREADLSFEEVQLGGGVTTRTLHAVAGAGTTPQVFAGGQRIGGAEELRHWLEKRKKPAEEAKQAHQGHAAAAEA